MSPQLNEAIEHAWLGYADVFGRLEKTPDVVKRIFDIGFTEGMQYAVRRLTTHVDSDKEQESAHKDNAE